MNKMKALLQLSILVQLISSTSQEVQELDFEDSLDMFQDCSIHLIENDLEVRFFLYNSECKSSC